MQIKPTAVRILKASIATVLLLAAPTARAWGDEGHEVIGLIAEHYLDRGVLRQVQKILSTDDTHLVPDTSIEYEATWADKYRDSDSTGSRQRYEQTRNWHFIDLEIDGPDIDAACFGHPPVATSEPASAGAAQDCVVDKINEFAEELKAPNTSATERREALQFLLHFVGDLHQPLHSSDAHDAGGNQKLVSAPGLQPGNLHRYWDTEFVVELGSDPATVAQALIDEITDADTRQWSSGTPSDWSLESFQLAKTHAYGKLPAPASNGSYKLPVSYERDAGAVVAQQLSRAGVRLAMLLNRNLATKAPAQQ